MEAHPQLAVVRLPVPRRPAALTFVVFYALASIVTAVNRQGFVVADGAIVANRLDLVTVHFVHTYFRRQVRVKRRQRAGFIYKVNELVHDSLARLAERWTYGVPRASRIVSVSDGTRREIEQLFPRTAGRTAVIPNGVDLAGFKPSPVLRNEVRNELNLALDCRIAAFIGGDWERKGLRFALAALSRATSWHLLVVGRGPVTEYARIAEKLGVKDRVLFLGQQAHSHRFMAAADCLVLPSAYEAFSLVSLEAAATGLPLLVTRVNGTEDLVRNGRNGWFIERDAAVIASRLNQLDENPAEAARVGARGRLSVRGYSWTANSKAYLSLIEGCPPQNHSRGDHRIRETTADG